MLMCLWEHSKINHCYMTHLPHLMFDWHLALLTWSDVLDETKLCYFFWIEISSLRHMRLGVSSGWCLCVSSTLQEQDQTSITCGRESLSLLHYFSLKISRRCWHFLLPICLIELHLVVKLSPSAIIYNVLLQHCWMTS